MGLVPLLKRTRTVRVTPACIPLGLLWRSIFAMVCGLRGWRLEISASLGWFNLKMFNYDVTGGGHSNETGLAGLGLLMRRGSTDWTEVGKANGRSDDVLILLVLKSYFLARRCFKSTKIPYLLPIVSYWNSRSSPLSHHFPAAW